MEKHIFFVGLIFAASASTWMVRGGVMVNRTQSMRWKHSTSLESL